MKNLLTLTGLLFGCSAVLAVACGSSDSSSAPAAPAYGYVHPSVDKLGPLVDEATACAAYSAAIKAKADAGCAVTIPVCPDFIRLALYTGDYCDEYEQAEIAYCTSFIASLTCEELSAHPCGLQPYQVAPDSGTTNCPTTPGGPRGDAGAGGTTAAGGSVDTAGAGGSVDAAGAGGSDAGAGGSTDGGAGGA